MSAPRSAARLQNSSPLRAFASIAAPSDTIWSSATFRCAPELIDISPCLLPRRRMHSVRRDLRARALERLGPPLVLPFAVPHAAEMRQHLAAEQVDILDR